MKHYTKADVDFHNEHYGRSYPAVNVKVHSLYHLVSKIEDHFKCTEETAQKALDFAFETNQEIFWNKYAQSLADDTFDYPVKIYSQGRSGGWLVVDGLPDFESWDAINLAKWHSFENKIKAEVKYLTSWDNIREDIESNQWYKEGSEKYNFYGYKDGHSECIADLKAELANTKYSVLLR